MTVKLLTEQHFEFLSLKGGCTGLSESTLVKMPHYCRKSHALAHIKIFYGCTCTYLRSEFDFWNAHGIINTSGLLH